MRSPRPAPSESSSPFRHLVGRLATMTLRREGPPGGFLVEQSREEDAQAPVLLLPGAELPRGAKPGDPIEVFVYLDSEDRAVATTAEPMLLLSEVTFLQVSSVTPIGAFFDWGLMKELLVPHAEQTRPVRVGERHPVSLYVDDSGRLAGTMRVSERLPARGDFALDEWVHGEAWRNEPGLGVFVILDRRCVGLLPEHEPHELTRGSQTRFRVANILADGKLELSLRGHGHEEVAADCAKILAWLRRPSSEPVGDRSSPELLRSTVGLSKKAFKRAAGRLLREGSVDMGPEGHLRMRGQNPVGSAPEPSYKPRDVAPRFRAR